METEVDDNSFQYSHSASEFLECDQLTDVLTAAHHFTLTNHTPSAISFRVLPLSQFYSVSLEGTKADAEVTLKPRKSIKVSQVNRSFA